MIRLLIQALRVFVLLSFIVGVLYPLAVTIVGQGLWKFQANGSLILNEQQVIGSQLLAQKTLSPRLFWPRPSASDFGTVPSGATNQGPTSEALKVAVQERRAKGMEGEMLFASGSGLDPHIGRDAAISQLARIVQERNLDESQRQLLAQLIENSVEKRDLGFLGEERINVLQLNLNVLKDFGR